MKYFKILAVLLLGQCFLTAQSIDDFIELTRAYDPGLEMLRLEYQAALQTVDQVGEWPDPTVNLAIGVLPIETRLGAQRFKVGVTQMIPWKGSLQTQKEISRTGAEIRARMEDVEAINIEFAIRSTYARLLYIESQKLIINERIEVLDAMIELAKSGVSSGKGKLSDVLITERRRETLQADLELLNLKMEQVRIMLNSWSGRPLDSNIDITPDFQTPTSTIPVSPSDLEGHPQFEVLDRQIIAADAVITNTIYQAKPQIGVGLEYAYVSKRQDVEIPGNGRDILMPMGSIRIPIFTNKYASIRKEQTIKKNAISEKRRDFQNKFTAEIEMAISQIEYAEAEIEKFESLKNITEETLELMRSEFAAEQTRFEELLKVEMELLDYDRQILSAESEKQLAQAVLMKY